jgi:hypothetical protein
MRYFEITKPKARYVPADADASDAADKSIWQLKWVSQNGADEKPSVSSARQRMKSEVKL